MLESKHVLRVDQEKLEAVILKIGGVVRIVNGAYHGSNARLLSVDTEKFCAKMQIEKGCMIGECLRLLSTRIYAKLLNEFCLEFWLIVMEFDIFALYQLFLKNSL
ncbi:hypothetical protein REPUB_Repub16aG0036000 [Reevesia pubescens]